MPTSTWAAYNFYDEDGDGWGDTWYAHWRTNVVDLTRPHSTYGVPYRYRSYDLGFQHWLAQTGKRVDIMSDEDLELFHAGRPPRRLRPDRLPRSHRVRDGAGVRPRRGVPRQGRQPDVSRREQLLPQDHAAVTSARRWSTSGATSAAPSRRSSATSTSPRTAASDRAPFTVVGAGVAPWAFEGTGLANGSTFGLYGIEIDARSRGVTDLDASARDDPRPLRAGSHRRDDLLRALERCEGLQRRGARLRRPDAPLAGDAADRRERLVTARPALARETPRRAARSSSNWS